MSLQPPLQPVRPGDLITSVYINDLLAALEAVEERVRELEQGSAGRLLSITDLLPSSTIRSGEELTVVGRNFEVPVSLNTVTVGSVRITTFNEASENRLVFNVLVPVTTRTEMDLTVRNNNGQAVRRLVVDPPAPRIPIGELFVIESFAGLGVIREDQEYIYLFRVRSETDINESYRFQVSFENAQGATAADWSDNAALVTPENVALPALVPLTNVERQIGVRVRVPGGAIGVTMILSARSQNSPGDPLLNKTVSVPIQIDQQQPVSDSRIQFGAPLVFGSGRLAADGAIELPIGGGQARIQTEVHFDVGGDYDITAAFDPDATDVWLAEPANPASTIEDDNGDQQVNVRLRSLVADPVAGRFLVIRIASTQTNTGESIISWTRIRVRGFA